MTHGPCAVPVLDRGNDQVGFEAADAEFLSHAQQLKPAGVGEHTIGDLVGGQLAECGGRGEGTWRSWVDGFRCCVVLAGQLTEGGISFGGTVGQPTADMPRLSAVGGGAVERRRPCHEPSLSPA